MAENDHTSPRDEPIKIPDVLPVLSLKDVVVFPYIILPLSVGREHSIAAVDQALTEQRMILLVAQRDSQTESPGPDDLYAVGTVAVIMRMLKLPDNRIRILVQGLARARVESWVQTEPFFRARIRRIEEPAVEGETLELEALIRSCKQNLEGVVSLGKQISPEVMVIAGNLDDPARLADLSASNLDLRVDDAQAALEIASPIERLRMVNEYVVREVNLLRMQQEISTAARGEMDKSQRDYFLRQQLKAIQLELGEGEELTEEIAGYREKIKTREISEEGQVEADKQIRRLERSNPDSAETAIIRTYLDWLTGLPWQLVSEDQTDLKRAREILDADHYDLEKIKARIIEFLAVHSLKKKMKGPILCFVGPPGVGKTSLGRSIARALGREFVRLSLGGVRDEAEIRGHRRTYVGALPGRIIQGINQAKTSNPVFMLDEIDKIGADFRGDPSSALLEVLDPEQNHAFRDHYLGVEYDLSRVLFIATANMLDPIQPAFLDRMEVIRLSGYTEDEKVRIALRYLVPKQAEENGIEFKDLTFTRPALEKIISGHTREAGLRNLEREIGSVCRKLAVKVASGIARKAHRITPSVVERLLGPERFQSEAQLASDQIGVATGLAWTPVGGDILHVEALLMKGTGKLRLTGHLGEVMKESAIAARSWARANAATYEIPETRFEENDIHVHVPAGATPKDGPSAGITMATAIISALSSRPINHTVAMTGELTLRGKVLPIGGVKEKVLAARAAGLTAVILPRQNKRDLGEIPAHLKKGMDFHWVDRIDQVLDLILLEADESKGASGATKVAKKSSPAKRRAAKPRPRPKPEPKSKPRRRPKTSS